jgi:hypothetical protein
LYIPTPKEIRKAYKPEEGIQHGYKSQFDSKLEESMYRIASLKRQIVQVSITSCSKLIIEHGNRNLKGIK